MKTRELKMKNRGCPARSVLGCGGERSRPGCGSARPAPNTNATGLLPRLGHPARKGGARGATRGARGGRAPYANTWRQFAAVLTPFCFFFLLSAFSFQASGQGTAFTYQGRLNDAGSPAHGIYDLRFAIYDLATGGSALAAPLTNSNVSVSNGLFTVTLDFGNPFDGNPRWLEIGARTNGAAGFTTLAPRQPLTPTPYAITAGRVVSGGLPAGTYASAVTFNNAANSFSGNFTGSGSGLTGVNAATLNGLGAASFWQTTGNAGTAPGADFVGTTDNQPLEFHVNGLRALRLEPTADTSFASDAPNVIAGSPSNSVAGVMGATIGGGGAANYFGASGANRIGDNFSTIGGGVGNVIFSNAWESTIGGGNGNNLQPGAYRSVIGGGWNNLVGTNADQSVIAGGVSNTINTNAGNSTVSGGSGNTVLTNAQYSTIAGGENNTVGVTINFAGTGYATIGGGYQNISVSSSGYTTIGGGYQNSAGGSYATVGGGDNNSAGGSDSTVSGGFLNSANGTGAMIPGGVGNSAGTQSFAAGALAHADNSDSFVWGDGSAAAYDHGANTFNVLATGGVYLLGVNGANASGGAPAYVNASGQLSATMPAFVHVTTAGNTIGQVTTIDNPLCNGKPGAILIVIQNKTSGVLDNVGPLAVFYDSGQSKWAIEAEENNITVGTQFNVLVYNF